MLENSSQIGPCDIAIVGMALRVPGARTTGEFWQNLRNGVESVRTLSADDLAEAGEDPERIHHPNYVKRTADLADMEMFDAEFFGMSPKDAAIMDPQHRQFLECAWEAMEDAGRTPDRETGPVGVFAGCGMGSYFYFNICSNRQLVDQVGMFLLRHTGNDKDFLATRASYLFDLHGPSINIQTACSTSLVAVHYACQSLINGESDMALAGGVTIEMPHRRGYMFNEGEILSPDGHCRPFDHRAAGTVFGSGAGVVVLRRLSDAIRDGDIIHAVIKSTAVNNDGAGKSGYLAPSVEGQAEAIIEAQGLAGIDAASIQYVECHGTGTYLGDPIEIAALTQAFRQSTDRSGFCRVGSVKSNIGHLDTAAGVVGLIKVALSLKHGEMPPTLGFEKPNPSIDFAGSPFLVNDKLSKWPQVQGPRRGAVNSLGVGGTNAHAILEQAPIPVAAPGTQAGDHPLVLMLSSRHRKGLDRARAQLAAHLSGQPAQALADVAYTLFHGRRHFEHRLVVAVEGRDDAIATLSDPAPSRTFVHTPVEAVSGAVFLFPGGGAQHPGMARALYRANADFRAHVDEGLSYLTAAAASEVHHAWLAEEADPVSFLRPSVQLPAILIVEVAISRLWMSWGVMPKALIGHSMGENAAACLAGVLSYRDAVNLVRLRGELFDTVEAGGMLSVSLDAEDLVKLLPPTLDMASVNAPGLCVVSGRDADLEAFGAVLAQRGVDTSRIPINIAAHSRMLAPILGRFEAFLRTLVLRPPAIPVMSNRSGTWLTAREATDPLYWVGHLRSTVEFATGMAALAQDPGRIYIEVGPGRTLSSLAKAQGGIDANRVINTLPHASDLTDDRLHFHAALGRAWATGLPVTIDALWQDSAPRRVSLPTYAFEHKRYFIEPATQSAGRKDVALVKNADIADWGYRPAWKKSVSNFIDGAPTPSGPWLVFLDEAGLGRSLVDRLRTGGARVVTVTLADTFARRSADDYVLCAEMGRPGYDALIAGLAGDGCLPSNIVHLWLVTREDRFRPGSNVFHRNQECGFDSLLFLAQALSEGGSTSDTHMTVVTNGMQRVGPEPVPYPEKATVLGPGLVIPKELDGVTVKLVDVQLPFAETSAPKTFFGKPRKPEADDAPPAFLVEQLWEDILAAPACETVAYRQHHRWSRVYEKMSLAAGEGLGSDFRRRGVYFFTGGLGDIALVLAGDLADRYQARIVLTGRLELPPREAWTAYDRLHGHDAIRRATSAIRKLEQRGAEVLYIKADVTNPEEMKQAVSLALARFGEINGVFHAAGLVDDAPLQVKSEDSIKRVLAPKLLGTTVLDDVFRDVSLDLVILFSSTSTDTAPAGQVDYVAANAYLNAYAESMSDISGRKTRAIHWGIWNDVGLAARAVGSEMRDLDLIPVAGPAEGPCFEGWTEDEQGRPWLTLVLSPQSHWMLDEHRLTNGQAVLPGTGYIELILQAAREYGLALQLDIRDLMFLKALLVDDRAPTELRVRLAPRTGGYRAVVTARSSADQPFETYAEAVLLTRSGAVSPVLDIPDPAMDGMVRQVAQPGATLVSAQAENIRFGRRWDVLKSLMLGSREAIAELELDLAYRLSDAQTLMHPALLDIATGYGMALVGTQDRAARLWVPMTYGSITVHKPLPASIVSRVRLSDVSEFGAGYAVFDVLVTEPDGDPVLEIRRFVMKQLEDRTMPAPVRHESAVENPAASQGHLSPALLRLKVQTSLGIMKTEGFDALLRALATNEIQPVISSIDLQRLRENAAVAARKDAPAESGFQRPDVDTGYVAPRDPVEETIAGYWRELLGVAQIGVDDNFFELGGHSLIAVRLFRMIKKGFSVDLPISVLFEAPTIARCADIVRAQMTPGETDAPASESVDALPAARPQYVVGMHSGPGRNAGPGQAAHPLFICAGMFGNVLNLRHLAAILGATRPVYGLQAKGLFGDQAPHECFKEAARDAIAEIRAVQPAGPYLLAGYSGGGLAALEIARQLQAAGETVSHVVMLDTPLPTQPGLSVRDKLHMKLQDIRRHKGRFLTTWLGDHAAWKLEQQRKKDAEGQGLSAEAFNNERIESAFRRALLRYELNRYDGSVTLLRPKPAVHYVLPGRRRLNATRDTILDDNGWTPHIDRLSVIEVPGDHDSMVLEPYVRVLAGRMRAAISEAEAGTVGAQAGVAVAAEPVGPDVRQAEPFVSQLA
ncbi:acyl transferase domain-containing protein [Rhizobium sp. PP-F2F-G48]|uniref:type I polyketide synthase n=1 Tax=Rhizobium sp. PP-F2F-G48 TaxID=2135651 RepID=UPI001047490F|nr:type I polyketide synthase [Rhizobium sp. PP-F2F-G48]TCM49658.1 acyl transferase domain-containing protein [Rhizobium sp. PP-F2F-G48]